jgi:hypothetical protein
VWSDEYVRTARILPPEPAKCGVDLLGASTAQRHQSIRPKNANFEYSELIARSCLLTTDFVVGG